MFLTDGFIFSIIYIFLPNTGRFNLSFIILEELALILSGKIAIINHVLIKTSLGFLLTFFFLKIAYLLKRRNYNDGKLSSLKFASLICLSPFILIIFEVAKKQSYLESSALN
jgi:hypothetical protein